MEVKKLHSIPFLLVLLAALFGPVGAQSQSQQAQTFETGKWGLELNYLTGNFLKHGTDLIPKLPSQGIELNYFVKTLGESPWHKGMNFPEYGGTLTFFYFGDNRVFGDAVSLMAFAKFFMVRSRVADFYFRVAGGYGYLSKEYNSVTNPNNSLISTPINLAVQLRLGLDWKITKYVQLTTAVNFNHFSNSAVQLPNIGLNMPNGSIGIRVFPHPLEIGYNCDHKKDFKKNEIMWKYSIGLMQLHNFNTNKYPVPGGTIAYARYINYGIKFYGGLSFEYFPAIHDYLVDNNIHTRYGATFSAAIPSAVIGNEFLLGRMGFFTTVGVYLYQNTATITPVYFKLGMNLYLAEIKKRKGTQFFFGNNVKAHYNVAQYNELSVGGTL